MEIAPLPGNEAQRLAALQCYQILDTGAEESFDDVTALAAQICGAPIALVSLIDANRQWFKSKVGVDATETPRDIAFCAHAIHRPDLLIVPDALHDSRFVDNPLVTGDPHIRFYAGMPLTTSEGYAMGTLCVIDRVPRELTASQQDALRRLGRQTIQLLELRLHEREHREAEAALREREARLQDFLDHVNDLIQSATLDGRLLFVNRAWRETLGYSEEDIPHLHLLDVIHPDSRSHCEQVMQQLGGSQSPLTIEAVFRTKAGRSIYVAGSVNCRFENGQPVSTRAIFRDVTAHKRAEQLLQQVHAELEQRVEARTAELRHANEALEDQIAKREQLERQLHQSQKMEALGRLASGVAHDFNNLLTIIKGYGDMMLAKPDLRKDLQSSLEQIKKATDRATGLTQQLLSFSRNREVEVKAVDVNSLIEHVASLLQRLVGERIRFTVALSVEPCWATLDPVGFEQVLINLVVNARDAMPDGGQVTIRTAIGDRTGSYGAGGLAGESGETVLVAVSDTGIGMDAATQARIFEPFYTTKPPGKGTGLGLATVYRVVEQSGVTITVVSAPGAGTTFSLAFPRLAASNVVPAAPVKMAEGRGAETILLAEDDLQVRALLKAVLTGAGYTVLEAGNGKEGLAVAQAYAGAIHLLLTDGVMPEMNGWDLARELIRVRPDVRVLFLTGYIDGVIPDYATLEQQGRILHKPVHNDVLIRTVREMLDRSVRSAVAAESGQRAWRILVMDDDAQIRAMIGDLLKDEPHHLWSCATGAEARNYLRTATADVLLVDMLMSNIHDLEAVQALRRERPTLPIIAMSDSGTVSPEFSMSFARQIGAVYTLAKPFSKRDLLQALDVTLEAQQHDRAGGV